MANGAFLSISIDSASVLSMLMSLDTCFDKSAMQMFMLQRAAPWLRRRTKSRFRNEGDDASGKWQQLAPATVKIRRAGIDSGQYSGISPDHPINRRTGEMEEFLSKSAGAFTFGSVFAELTYPGDYPNPSVYKKVATAQGRTPKTRARPVLAVNAVDMLEVTQSLSRFIRERVTI